MKQMILYINDMRDRFIFGLQQGRGKSTPSAFSEQLIGREMQKIVEVRQL